MEMSLGRPLSLESSDFSREETEHSGNESDTVPVVTEDYTSLSPTFIESDGPRHSPCISDSGMNCCDDETSMNEEPSWSPSRHKFRMIVLCFSVMMGGALNNVLGKIRSKPLGACNYFVSIINPIAYSLIYFTILVSRHSSHQYDSLVTSE